MASDGPPARAHVTFAPSPAVVPVPKDQAAVGVGDDEGPPGVRDLSAKERGLLAAVADANANKQSGEGGDGEGEGGEGGRGGEAAVHRVRFAGPAVVEVPRDQVLIPLDDELSTLEERRGDRVTLNDVGVDGAGQRADDDTEASIDGPGAPSTDASIDAPPSLGQEPAGQPHPHPSPMSSTTAVPPSDASSLPDPHQPPPRRPTRDRLPSRDRAGVRAASDLSLRELELLEEHHVEHDGHAHGGGEHAGPADGRTGATGGNDAAQAETGAGEQAGPTVEPATSSSSSSEEEEEERPRRTSRARSLSAGSASRVTFSPLPSVVPIPKDQPHLHVLHHARSDEEGGPSGKVPGDLSAREVELLHERGGEEESKVTFSETAATVRIPKTQSVVPLDLARIRGRSASSSRNSPRSPGAAGTPPSPGDNAEDEGAIAHLGSHWASDLSMREVEMLESKMEERAATPAPEEPEGWEDDEGGEADDGVEAAEGEGERYREGQGHGHRRSLTPSGGFAKVTFSPRPAVVTISKDQPTIPLALPPNAGAAVPVLQARVGEEGDVQLLGEEGVGRDLSGREVEMLSAKLSERGDSEDAEAEGEGEEGEGEGEEGDDEYADADEGDGDDPPPGGAQGGAGGGGGGQGPEDSDGDEDAGDAGPRGAGDDRPPHRGGVAPRGNGPRDAVDGEASDDLEDPSIPRWTPGRRASIFTAGSDGDSASTDPDPAPPPPAAPRPVHLAVHTGERERGRSPSPTAAGPASPSLIARFYRSPSAQMLAGAIASGVSTVAGLAQAAASAAGGTLAPGRGANILAAPTMEAFAAFLRQRRPGRVVVLTGAGISTSAGLADFRSEAGIYARFDEWKARIGVPYPEAVFDLNYFRQDPKPFYAMMRELFGRKAGHVPMPTEAHWFMRLLYEKGILLRNYTQNIDSLEHLAGLPSELVVESHGHFRSASCTGRLSSGFGGLPEDIPACGAEYPPSYVRRFLEKEPWGVPTCARCGGWVKPALTFFGEALPPTFWDAARADFDEAEAMIVMGTSLQVQPFASLIERVPPTCARLMINRDPPKFGPFRRTARRLALWNERSRLGQNPRQVLREDDSDADDDLVHGYDHDGAPKRGHDAFGDLVQQFDFALEEEAEAMGGNAVRDPNRAKLRDAIHLGDADEAVAELCRMLGWEADLARVRAEGEARYERYRAEHGDGGWWSVFEFAASPPDEKADPAGAEKRGTRMGGMAGGANEAWARLQSRFGVETPRECEFM